MYQLQRYLHAAYTWQTIEQSDDVDKLVERMWDGIRAGEFRRVMNYNVLISGMDI